MADYQLRAYTRWNDRFEDTWTINIYEDGYAESSPLELLMGGEPLEFRFGPSGDLYSVLKSIEAILSIVVPYGDEDDYTWLYQSYRPLKIKLEVLLNSNIFYYGYLLGDSFIDNLSYIRVFEIVFSDNINLLEDKLFLNGSVAPVDPATLLAQISHALEETSLELNINIAVNIFHVDMNRGGAYDPLDQAYLSQMIWQNEDFSPGNCKTVLEEISKLFWIRIFQSEGEWWVCRIRDFEKENVLYRKFTYAGVYISNGTLTPRLSISTSLTKFDPEIYRLHGEIELLPEWAERSLEIDYSLKPSLISGLVAENYWSDTVTHRYWTNAGSIWTYRSAVFNGLPSGHLYAETDGRTSLNTSLKLYSPLVGIYAAEDSADPEFSYTFSVFCGRNKRNFPLISYCKVQVVLALSGVPTYEYSDSDGEWHEINGSPKYIGGIDFPEIDTSGDIALNLQERKVDVKAPPVDGQLIIMIYAPYKITGLANETIFYLGDISFTKTSESENLPNGEVDKVIINPGAFYIPEPLQVKINGGAVIRQETAVETDRYYGLLSLTSALESIEDSWVEIYDTDSDEYKKLTDWILYHWYRHNRVGEGDEAFVGAVSRNYEGGFIGRGIKFNSILKVGELFSSTYTGELYIPNDVTYKVRSGIWTGNWHHLKSFALKLDFTFSPEMIYSSINKAIAGNILPVSPVAANDYRANTETVLSGEQSITFLTPFASGEEFVLEKPIAGITADGEIMWVIPYDITTEGFKVNFDYDVTISYRAHIIK